jgi:hypothetical protein
MASAMHLREILAKKIPYRFLLNGNDDLFYEIVIDNSTTARGRIIPRPNGHHDSESDKATIAALITSLQIVDAVTPDSGVMLNENITPEEIAHLI